MTNIVAKKESAEFSEGQMNTLAIVPVTLPGNLTESNDGEMINEVKATIEESRKRGIGDPQVAAAIEGVLNSNKSLDALDLIDLKKVAQDGIREFNRLDKTGKGLVAVSGISLGRVHILIKRKVEAQGINWNKYAKANLNGMSQRTREKYMTIARRKDAAEFSHLGVENLYHVAMAAKGMSGDTPITDFVEKYHIDTNTEREIDSGDFELQVKTATLQQRAVSAGITLEKKTAIGFVTNKVKLNTADFQVAKEIKAAGGHEAKYFERKAIAAGSKNKPPETPKTTSRIKSFSKVATAMEQVISEALSTSDVDILKDIDPAKVDQLLRNLNELKLHIIKQ